MKNSPLKILFVCGHGMRRSATAERIFWDAPHIEAKSGGILESSRRRIRSIDIQWADLVIVMDRKTLNSLERAYPLSLQDKVVRVLNITDDYEFMDEELISILKQSVGQILSVFNLND